MDFAFWYPFPHYFVSLFSSQVGLCLRLGMVHSDCHFGPGIFVLHFGFFSFLPFFFFYDSRSWNWWAWVRRFDQSTCIISMSLGINSFLQFPEYITSHFFLISSERNHRCRKYWEFVTSHRLIRNNVHNGSRQTYIKLIKDTQERKSPRFAWVQGRDWL